MAKRTNWWLEGWKYEETLGPNGSRRKKLVYSGEYYTFGFAGKRLAALKAAATALTVFLLAGYGLAFLYAQTAMPRIFVGACMLIVIPLMYLLIGVGCLMPVGEKLTYRDYRGSVIRIRWTSLTIAGLALVGLLGEAGYLLLAGGERLPRELWWLAGIGITFLCALALALLERKHHPRLIPPELK